MTDLIGVRTWTILSPVSPPPPEQVAGGGSSPKLGRPIAGARVGLKIDYFWNCYRTVIDEWEHLLRADSAQPDTLWSEGFDGRDPSDRRDPHEVRADVDEIWSQLIDCAVVGLGN
jgi:hypothetical protein